MMKRVKLLAAAALMCCTAAVFAKNQSVVFASFDYGVPIVDEFYTRTMGATVGYEFEPFSLLGIYGSGFYHTVSLQGGVDSQLMYGGNFGAAFNLYLGSVFKLHLFADAGVYNIEGYIAANGVKKFMQTAGISCSCGTGLSMLINPGIAVKTTAAYKQFWEGSGTLMQKVELSAGITFNFQEQLNTQYNVTGILLNTEPVFPVLYAWYEKNKFADFEIVNNEDRDIKNVTVSFYQGEFMLHPEAGAKVKSIKKGRSAVVPLTAFFDESIMNQTTTGLVQAKVLISYSYSGQKRTVEVPVEIVVYQRNSMSWTDDRRASVFVTSNDPNVLAYSKMIQSIVRRQKRAGANENMQYCMCLFQSLGLYGLNYVVDPTSSYADNVGKDTIDFLQFPYQTLAYKGGDCDDISILNCALIDAAGIDCAFITVPGHIYIAFDTGVDETVAAKQFGSLDKLIVQDGKVWLPVEITLTHENFDVAWKAGIAEWNEAAKNGNAKLYPMSKNRALYTPTNVPGVQETVTLPDEDKITASFNKMLDKIN